MQLEANTLREMYFYSNAMIVNEDDSLIYNQIKGDRSQAISRTVISTK